MSGIGTLDVSGTGKENDIRADRLLALLLLLDAHGQMTAARLALELEVTKRTIYRDVYALRVSGFPIDSVKGTRGGYRLHSGQLGRLAQLTYEEIAALLLTPMPPLVRDLGWTDRFRGASLKLASALERKRRAPSMPPSERILLDSSPWDEQREAAPHLQTLHQALVEKRRVDVRFVRAREVEVSRSIGPCGLVGKALAWYVVWVDDADAIHVDRVSQIVTARLTDDRFTPPEGFDLQVVWEDWCRLRRTRQRQFVAKIRIRPDAVRFVQQHLEDRMALSRPDVRCDGWPTATVRFSWLDEARAVLLGLGAAIEVMAPEPLRRSIESHARHTAQLYVNSVP
jgi:predicted DNA-binding transcriptional regulator YafY